MMTEERFLRDVAKHEMTIVMDNGIHRNVVFKNPDDSNMWFGLLTWPNHLCFYGDMGTFVFNRMDDMFAFFRKGVDGDPIYINTGYWSEKITASDRHGGAEEFSDELFRSKVNQEVEDFLAGLDIDHFSCEEKKKAFTDALREEVEHEIFFTLDDEGQHAAIAAACGFSFERDGLTFDMQDFYENNFMEYTPRFVWACYAIQWGIRKYDVEVAK